VVVAELARRDRFDSSRATSPLQIAEDAIVVDSTKMSVDEVVEEVLSHL
jgi:cytidylate kinase